MKRMLHALSLCIALAFLFQPASAQRTVRMNLERMVTHAGLIVHGTVTNVTSSVDPRTNILSTFVTIAVKENFYGANEQTVTLKMAGGSSKRSTLKFSEMPSFTVGEEIYSFFYAPSKYGFTSPVGMGQGKFTVIADAAAQASYVRNAANNSRLFAGMKNAPLLKASPAGSAQGMRLTAEELSTTIRSLVTTLKK